MTGSADDDRSNPDRTTTNTNTESETDFESDGDLGRERMGTDEALWRVLRERYRAAFHTDRSRADPDRSTSGRGINFGTDPHTGEVVRVDPFSRQGGENNSHILTIGDEKSGKTTGVARAAAEWLDGDSSRTVVICYTGGSPSRSIDYRGITELYEGRYLWPGVGRSLYTRLALPLSSVLGVRRLESFVSPIPARWRFTTGECEPRVIHIDIAPRPRGLTGIAIGKWLMSKLRRTFRNTSGETLVIMDDANDFLLNSSLELPLRRLLDQVPTSKTVFWLVAEPQAVATIENRAIHMSQIVRLCGTIQAFRSARVPPAALEFIGFEEHDAARAGLLTDPTPRDPTIECLLALPGAEGISRQYHQWRELSVEITPRERTILDYRHSDDGPLADYLQEQRRHHDAPSADEVKET